MAPASRIFVAREIDSNGDLNGAALFGHALVALGRCFALGRVRHVDCLREILPGLLAFPHQVEHAPRRAFLAVLSMLNSRIIGFYSGTEPDHRGRYLHEIQQWADDKLQAVDSPVPSGGCGITSGT